MTPSGPPPLKIKVIKQFVLKVKVRKRRKERKKEREKEKKLKERSRSKRHICTDTYLTEKGWGSDISVATKSMS